MSFMQELREILNELKEDFRVENVVFKREWEEAKQEIDKKNLGGAEYISAFRSALKCTENLLDATECGGHNIFCVCGYHPSRFRPK